MSIGSQRSILIVDYENAGKIDLSTLSADAEVHVFIGAAQKSVPTELLEIAHKLEKRFALTRIEGQEKLATKAETSARNDGTLLRPLGRESVA